ncbi:MAG: hypothetical protein ACLSS0_04440 [Clostridioides difficile]
MEYNPFHNGHLSFK